MKIRLTDGRDASFEIIGTLEEVCKYLGYEGVEDFYDLDEQLEAENAGMNFYHVEEVEED